MKNYCIIRTSWLYSEFGNNFAKTILQLGTEKEAVQVIGNQIGSPTYSMDLAETIVFLINSKLNFNGIYHFSNKGAISWYDFTVELFKQKNAQVKIEKILSSQYKTYAKRPNYSVLSLDKIFQDFGIKPNSWKESLNEFSKK